MAVVVNRKTGGLAIRIERAADVAQIVALGIHILRRDSWIKLPYRIDLDHPIHLGDGLHISPRAHLNGAEVRHENGLRQGVVTSRHGEDAATVAGIHRPLEARRIICLARKARKLCKRMIRNSKRNRRRTHSDGNQYHLHKPLAFHSRIEFHTLT